MVVWENWPKGFVGVSIPPYILKVVSLQDVSRASAVNGAVYVLGHRILSLGLPDESQSLPASIELEGVPDILTADIVITDQKHLLHAGNIAFPPESACRYACAILVLDQPMNVPIPKPPEGEDKEVSLDSCIVTFPPGSLSNGVSRNVVRALQMGQETLSCPSDKCTLSIQEWMRIANISLASRYFVHVD